MVRLPAVVVTTIRPQAAEPGGLRGQLPPLADKGGQTVSNAPHFADLVE